MKGYLLKDLYSIKSHILTLIMQAVMLSIPILTFSFRSGSEVLEKVYVILVMMSILLIFDFWETEKGSGVLKFLKVLPGGPLTYLRERYLFSLIILSVPFVIFLCAYLIGDTDGNRIFMLILNFSIGLITIGLINFKFAAKKFKALINMAPVLGITIFYAFEWFYKEIKSLYSQNTLSIEGAILIISVMIFYILYRLSVKSLEV